MKDGNMFFDTNLTFEKGSQFQFKHVWDDINDIYYYDIDILNYTYIYIFVYNVYMGTCLPSMLATGKSKVVV